MSNAMNRLKASLELTADAPELTGPLSDFLPEVIDESGAPKWFNMLRTALGIIFGGASKVKLLKVTPNSCHFKFRALGLVLDYKAIVKFAMLARKTPNLEFAFYTQNQRLYLLVVEKE